MEFKIMCPNDGEIIVGFNNIENMIIRDNHEASITFICPYCGSRISMTAPVPSSLIATMENLSRDFGIPMKDGNIFINPAAGEGLPPMDGGSKEDARRDNPIMSHFERAMRRRFEQDESTFDFELHELNAEDDAMMTYFEHQLKGIETVEDFLNELNG